MDSCNVVQVVQQESRSNMGNLTSNTQRAPEGNSIVREDGSKGKLVHGTTNAENFQLQLQQAIAATAHDVGKETNKKHHTTKELEHTNTTSNCISTVESGLIKIGTTQDKDKEDFQNHTQQNIPIPESVKIASQLCPVISNNVDLPVEQQEHAQKKSRFNSSDSHDLRVVSSSGNENWNSHTIIPMKTGTEVATVPEATSDILAIESSHNPENFKNKGFIEVPISEKSTKDNENAVSIEVKQTPDYNNFFSSSCKKGDVTIEKQVSEETQKNLSMKEVDSLNRQEAKCLLEDEDFSIGCIDDKIAENVQKAVEEFLQTQEATISEICKNTEIEGIPREVDKINKSNDRTANACNAVGNVIDENKNEMTKGEESEGVLKMTDLLGESPMKDTLDHTDAVPKSLQDVVECVIQGRREASEEFSVSELCSETMEQIVVAAMSKPLDDMFDSQIAKKNSQEESDSRCNTKDLDKLQLVDELNTPIIVDLLEEPKETENLFFTTINRLARNINAIGKSEMEELSAADIELSEKRLQAVLHQIETLKSIEYLWFYLKLAAKCNNKNNNNTESKASENNIRVDQCEDKKKLIVEVQKLVDSFVHDTSVRKVADIEDEMKILSEAENTWLYLNLPSSGLLQLIKPCNSAFSQTVMWLKTNFQCVSSGSIAKQSVYNAYCEFCQRYQLVPLTIVGFGNIVKQIYPKVGQRRMGPKSQSRLHYLGMQRCFKLPTPHLPKLSKQSEEQSNELSSQMSCHECCQINLNLYKLHIKKLNKKSSKTKVSTFQQSLDDKDSDSYRSGKLDGKTIMVHDPLALLNLSLNDKSDNDRLPHPPCEEVYVKCEFDFTSSSNQLSDIPQSLDPDETRALRSRPSTTINKHGVRNKKFKQYKHPSVHRLLRKYQSLVLPQKILQANVDPAVILNNGLVNNWRAERIRETIEKVSSLVISQIEGSVNFKVTCLCCDDVFEVTETQGKQLKNLKDKLSSISVTKLESSSEYQIACIVNNVSSPAQALLSRKQLCVDPTSNSTKLSPKQLCDDSVQITKKLNVRAIKTEDEVKVDVSKLQENKHPSVQNLLKTYENVILPAEVFKSDIEPVIVLDSAEVFEWYSAQLDNLKERLANSEQEKCTSCDVKLESTANLMPARRTRAKMMNFCEIESSDEDNDQAESYQPLSFLDELADGTLQTTTEKASLAPPFVSVPIKLDSNPITYRPKPIVSSVFIDKSKNENVQTQQLSLKRPSNEVAIEMVEHKRTKLCTGTTVSLANNANTKPIVVEEIQPPESEASPTAEGNDEYFVCFFCEETTTNTNDFVAHERTHTSCRSCKRRLKNTEIMRLHLIRHCSINSSKRKPFLRLQRIDSVPSALEKFPDALKKLTPSGSKLPNILKKVLTTNSRSSCTKSKSRSTKNPEVSITKKPDNLIPANRTIPKTARTYARVQTSTAPSVNQEATTTGNVTTVAYDDSHVPVSHLQGPPALVELKSTISNNLNKILLLSNHGTQPPSSNVVYRFFLNNTNGQVSPSLCLAPTDAPLNPTLASPGIDCAYNVNPSCSNAEFQQPGSFMQIVETPPPALIPYTNPIVMQNEPLVALQHRDHSYHQQPMVQMGNDITRLNNLIVLRNNVPQAQLESVVNGTADFRGPLEQRFKPPDSETANQSSNEEGSDNGDLAAGQFKIRVKSLNELR